MIGSFANRVTERVFFGKAPRSVAPELARAAERKLRLIASASFLEELRIPPGNRLEALRGDRAGRHSIRINDQWRITFVWRDGAAYDVLIEDYH